MVVYTVSQIPVFQKCVPVVYVRLGVRNDDYWTLTKLHWLVWEHQAWRYVKHIEIVLLLTYYETLITLIGYYIIANQLWCKYVYINTTGTGLAEKFCSSIHLVHLSRVESSVDISHDNFYKNNFL